MLPHNLPSSVSYKTEINIENIKSKWIYSKGILVSIGLSLKDFNTFESILKQMLGGNPTTCFPGCHGSFPWFQDKMPWPKQNKGEERVIWATFHRASILAGQSQLQELQSTVTPQSRVEQWTKAHLLLYLDFRHCRQRRPCCCGCWTEKQSILLTTVLYL